MTTPRPQPVTFLAASPLAEARRHAEADVKKRATPAQVEWLHQHPLLWLRALIGMRHDAETHIAKDKLGYSELKPGVEGDHVTWRRIKADLDRRTLARTHFIWKVASRMEEVKALIGAEAAVDRMLVGDVIADMLRVAYLARIGRLGDTAGLAESVASRWAERYGSLSQEGTSTMRRSA